MDTRSSKHELPNTFSQFSLSYIVIYHFNVNHLIQTEVEIKGPKVIYSMQMR